MSEQQLVLMRMPLGPLGTNCYVIGDKAIGEAFIIDPATAEVLDALKKHDLKPKAIVLTHGHGDHIEGLNKLTEHYPEAKVYVGEEEKDFLYNFCPKRGKNAFWKDRLSKFTAVSRIFKGAAATKLV